MRRQALQSIVDKAEMENEYKQFSMQYNEMMTQINNDSLINQLAIEQQRSDSLLRELQRTKADDAREIIRLKKELATLRQVLRDYIMQIDSLGRENEALRADNSNLRQENQQAQASITDLASKNEQLSDKVAIASQLDATAISATARNKRGKEYVVSLRHALLQWLVEVLGEEGSTAIEECCQ